MEVSSPRAAKPSTARAFDSFALFVSVGVLFYLWTLNYNKLGSFYDYSIVTDAAGKLSAGLHPFRDFSSALQSMPMWLARACELIFGPSYLALAYGNLVLTLILFSLILHYARKSFPFLLSIPLALSITVASSLQHGIIWYNSIALLLLSAVTLKCADLLRTRKIRLPDVLQLSALLLMIGMTKLNFDAVAIGTAALFAFVGFISCKPSTEVQNKRYYLIWIALCLAACAALPFIEVLANRTDLHTWAREVVIIPASRASGLASLFRPGFYFREWNAFYPGTLLNGSVFFCLLIYGFITYAVVIQFFEAPKNERSENFKGLVVRLALLCLFWLSTCLLALTNVEIESLTLCYCLVGLIAMRVSGEFSGHQLQKILRNSSAVLAVYFLLVGGVSVARHSRIAYRGNDFADASLYNAGSTAGTAASNPEFLRGVMLSPQAVMRLTAAGKVVKDNGPASVYWGPGMEIMNEIYGGVTDPAFPLWYHFRVTVRDADAQTLIHAIDRSRADVFVSDPPWLAELPEEVKLYFDESWESQYQYAPLSVYKRRAR